MVDALRPISEQGLPYSLELALAALHRLALGRAQRQVRGVDHPAPGGRNRLDAAGLDQVAELAAGLAEAVGGVLEAEQHGT